MKWLIVLTVFAASLFVSSAGFAEEQTVKLSLPDMSCASCPYMVKQAISSIEGIKMVTATMEDRSATVIFENTVTDVKAIQQATNDIGYKSFVVALN